MRKLDALRRHLLTSVPDLARNPDKLLTFVQDGHIMFRRGEHLSHQYTMPAQIIITDYAADMDELMVPLLQWLARYEPASDANETVPFEAEILDNHTVDIALTVTLTERVVAVVDCDAGAVHAEHRMPEYPTDHCPPQHWQLYTKLPGQADYGRVSEWDSPSDG